MNPYTVIIRARADGREQSVWLDAPDRDAALFEAGRLVGKDYSGRWELVRISEGSEW